MAIRFVVDSAADIPDHIARTHDIAMVPLSIHFGDRIYKDRVDLSPEDFLFKLKNSSDLPNTSQPSPGEFLEVYEAHWKPGDTLFSFHLSSKFSGTYQSAVLASRQLSDRQIHVIDTGLASMGIGMPAIAGARWASQGASADEIKHLTAELIASTRSYFLVDTLDFIDRDGRIGRAKALVGSVLNIKPVLCVQDGLVDVADRLRGFNKAFARLLELALGHLKEDASYMCAIMEADQSELAEEIEATIRQQASCESIEIIKAPLGATIGTHTGPGTVGIVIGRLPKS